MGAVILKMRSSGVIFLPGTRHLVSRCFRGGFIADMQRSILAGGQKAGLFRKATVPASGAGSGPESKQGVSRELKPVLKFAKLSENATAPTKASARAAGYDLYSAHDCSIGPMEKAVVNTDIQIAVPAGCYGRVAPRSGLAANYFIDIGAGVIDEDYRGNVGVVLFNFNKETFQVKKGDRIAQLICEKICHTDLEQHEELDKTTRGDSGFGSTGQR